MEEGEKHPAGSGFEDGLACDQHQRDEAGRAGGLVILCTADQFKCADGHESVAQPRQAAVAVRPRAAQADHGRCHAAQGGRRNVCQPPQEMPFGKLRIEDEESRPIQQQMVPAHMDERVRQDSPPLPGQDFLRQQRHRFGESAPKQRQVQDGDHYGVDDHFDSFHCAAP